MYSGVGFQLRILHAIPTLVCCLLKLFHLWKLRFTAVIRMYLSWTSSK